METVLDSLPDRPLTVEDVAKLNNSVVLQVLPYTWYGEQVIAALLLSEGGETSTDSAGEPDESAGVGTVEIIETGPADGKGEATEDIHVYVVGYHGGQSVWVVIGELDPDAELTRAESIIREWAIETYNEETVADFAVGPSEYERNTE